MDSTPCFLELNKIQALGERRIGLCVMGLHTRLINMNRCRLWFDCGNSIINNIFQLIA
nr:hypothetical protein [Spiroplasma endosymbiont of 'Nebria riversi']